MDENLFLNKELRNVYNSKRAYNLSEIEIVGRSENDATHPLLRTDRHPTKFVLCLSCKRHIQNNSLSDICAHYMVYPHLQSFVKCLYCTGNVHHYLHPERVLPEVFHYCSPRKQEKKTLRNL